MKNILYYHGDDTLYKEGDTISKSYTDKVDKDVAEAYKEVLDFDVTKMVYMRDSLNIDIAPVDEYKYKYIVKPTGRHLYSVYTDYSPIICSQELNNPKLKELKKEAIIGTFLAAYMGDKSNQILLKTLLDIDITAVMESISESCEVLYVSDEYKVPEKEKQSLEEATREAILKQERGKPVKIKCGEETLYFENLPDAKNWQVRNQYEGKSYDTIYEDSYYGWLQFIEGGNWKYKFVIFESNGIDINIDYSEGGWFIEENN